MGCNNYWNVHINRIGILLLWLTYVDNADCAYWTQSLYKNSTRIRRQANCKANQFPCKSGTCILDTLACDGAPNCPDGSDETREECQDILCNSAFGYKCEYGACVNKEARCNGKKECADNSDEAGCTPTANICASTEFACTSGECIEDTKLCDGQADCQDHSDETIEQCGTFLNCINSFRCKYGACVSKTAECNGIKECFDGSDEEGCTGTVGPKPVTLKPPVTPPPKPPIDGSCIVSKVPNNGVFINNNSPGNTFKPGDFVPPFNALITKCNRGYKTSPPNKSFPICLNGEWLSPPLECARFCRSANSSKSTKIACKFDGIPLSSCIDPVDGTIASIKCEYLYEGGQVGNPTRVCRDGSWDYPITECTPVCGQKRPKGKPNVIGGDKATKGDYPWHVGFYYNDPPKTHICGGSIISQLVVISAAHCFTTNEGELQPKENYLMAAGKYYRPYDDDRDINAQYPQIKKIYIPERYKGATGNYEADIAAVVLNEPLAISVNVQPVCVDWYDAFEYQQLYADSKGVVVGWGYTEKGENPSMELKELTVPYITYEQCFDRVPREFRKFLTYDKVCAGFLHRGVAVCQGDSGGGLTFIRKSDDHYFLRGVVSTSPRSEDSCDPDQYATYTLISKHLRFVQDIETVNRIV